MTLKINKNWLCSFLLLYCVKGQKYSAQDFMYNVYSDVLIVVGDCSDKLSLEPPTQSDYWSQEGVVWLDQATSDNITTTA